MDNLLKTGLIMQFVQLIIAGILTSIYILLTIRWTWTLLLITILVIFNLISIILIILGLILNNSNK